jgi:hypothetical protein
VVKAIPTPPTRATTRITAPTTTMIGLLRSSTIMRTEERLPTIGSSD